MPQPPARRREQWSACGLGPRQDGRKDMTTPTAPETATQPRTVTRPARPPAQLWQVPTFLAGLLALLTVTVASAFRPLSAARQLEHDLAAIRQGLKDKVPPTSLVELTES